MESGTERKRRMSDFRRVLLSKDVLVIAFGAMIGWGWVVSTGNWIESGGVLGAALGFVIGGIMIFFVGLTYAELTSAMPLAGGEHVFSHRAMGPYGSFVCTWAIILGYVSVICFEACSLPTIIAYIFPDFLQCYLYTVAGFDIYLTWLATAIIFSAFITYINVRGIQMAAAFQKFMTIIIMLVGVLIIVSGVVCGDVSNLDGQMFIGDDTGTMAKAVLTVALITPFFFIGFDVIPQAAEEIKIPMKKVGRILLTSVLFAIAFYSLIIVAVGLILDSSGIASSISGSGLVTADALAKAFNSDILAKVVIIGGLCGIITSWNAFMIGGSRAMYSMAKTYMIPPVFGKIHKKYHTPVNALYMIGFISMLAPFLGRKILVWIVDAGNMGCCLAYLFVAVSFLILRKTQPDMPRPFKVRHYKAVGAIAILMSGFMVLMYLLPGSGSTLANVELAIVGAWFIMGLIFLLHSRHRYGTDFGRFDEVIEHSPEGETNDMQNSKNMENLQ